MNLWGRSKDEDPARDRKMSFNYKKLKDQQESGSHWTSYSDLFMMLSIVFLMLYVWASWRAETQNIQKFQEYKQLAHEAQDLKQQIKVYNTLRGNYLTEDATEGERVVYNQLMDKLSLLKEEASEEKELLRRQAFENEKKEDALNQYQQLVRNIINTNLLAKGRIKRRDVIIQKREDVIAQKRDQIKELEKDIKDKKWIQKNQGTVKEEGKAT